MVTADGGNLVCFETAINVVFVSLYYDVHFKGARWPLFAPRTRYSTHRKAIVKYQNKKKKNWH